MLREIENLIEKLMLSKEIMFYDVAEGNDHKNKMQVEFNQNAKTYSKFHKFKLVNKTMKA